MQDLKYLTIPELEKFCDNLRLEIDHLKKTVEHQNTRYRDKTVAKQTLEVDEDMLNHAEAEILERTLLK